MKTDRAAEAAQSFTKAIQAGQMTQASYYNRGMCRVKLEDGEGAMADFRAALEGDDPEVTLLVQAILDQVEERTEKTTARIVFEDPSLEAGESGRSE